MRFYPFLFWLEIVYTQFHFIMSTNDKSLDKAFPAPQGNFTYLDNTKLIKSYPGLKRSYLIVNKDGIEHHLFVFDHETDQLILTNEVREILKSVYPEYQILMQETFKENDMDFEKICFGIALGMRVFEMYKKPIIHFRSLHTYAYTQKPNFKGKNPLGDPNVPKDKSNLGFIYQSYDDKKGRKMYTYDGYIFPEEVLEILLHVYEIVEPGILPEIYKGNLTDVWRLKWKP